MRHANFSLAMGSNPLVWVADSKQASFAVRQGRGAVVEGNVEQVAARQPARRWLHRAGFGLRLRSNLQGKLRAIAFGVGDVHLRAAQNFRNFCVG